MSPGLVVYPVEARFYSQSGQHPVFSTVPVASGDVHGTALVMKRVLRVNIILVPRLRHTQLDVFPLVHDRDGQSV